MNNKWLKRAILTVVAYGSLMGVLPSVEAAEVRILPVDKAKFWAGAKSDFDVEVKGARNLQNVDITVNGQLLLTNSSARNWKPKTWATVWFPTGLTG